MLEVLPAAEDVVALRVSGHVDASDIEGCIAAIENALDRQERIALYAEIAMTGISPGAFVRDLGYDLGKLRELHRFVRLAVVTEQEWIRRIAQAQGHVLPQIAMRTFAPAERDEAMAWVAQPIRSAEPEPVAVPPAVHFIETSSAHVVAFEVNGRIRRDDMHRLIAAFEHALGAHPRLQVLVRVVDFDGVSLEALREEGLATGRALCSGRRPRLDGNRGRLVCAPGGHPDPPLRCEARGRGLALAGSGTPEFRPL